MKQNVLWILIAVLTANAVVTWFMIAVQSHNVDVAVQEALAARELEIASRYKSALNVLEEDFGLPQSNPQSLDEFITSYSHILGKVTGI